MPGFTTHYLFGQQTYQSLQDSEQKRAIQKYNSVFALGLQGPDIFFYDVISAVLAKKNPGSTAHTADTRRFLRQLLDSPRIFPDKKDRRIAQVYISGFIGHYLLDTVCHPYVYAMTHYGRHPKGYIGQHIRLETDIDTTLLQMFLHRQPSEFHQNETIAVSKEQREIISALLYYSFSRTYPGLGITRHGILQAIHAMQLGTKLLYDPTGRKKIWIRRIESIVPGYPLLSPLVPNDKLIFHKDPCNLRHKSWRNPWDARLISSESFPELFEKARRKYCRMLKELERFFLTEYTPEESARQICLLLAHLGNLCYHSGLNAAAYLL
ncbi:hypothetical protein IMSAGC012_01724 [Lachnospiraceae bacterium]|jgi:hypothetical protein|nr:zinc dependent phospholipase C family protein [Eubacterium sp.]GFI26603.1 hypothetical protein IMSAGC012_01724 [Lachnospiraceae bacterium]